MTLKITLIDHDEHCFGWLWSVTDENALAAKVAAIAMGQYRHVARVLAGARIDPPKGDAKIEADAISALTLNQVEDAKTLSRLTANRRSE